jgi:hypothetical protein
MHTRAWQTGVQRGGRTGSGVEEARRQGSLFDGKPVCDGFECRGEIGGFTQAECEPRDAETHYRSRECVADGREAPYDNCEGQTLFCTDAIDQSTGDQKAQAVGYNEPGDDVAVMLVIERNILVAPEHVLEDRFDQPKRGTIDVVDGCDEKQESADRPSQVRLRGLSEQVPLLFDRRPAIEFSKSHCLARFAAPKDPRGATCFALEASTAMRGTVCVPGCVHYSHSGVTLGSIILYLLCVM